ncbi:ACT domain-containing protein [Promicromonospora kroppenstedtii]|uniref:ACT domain-containing protein n=1 Tax=Promicromonospora kroppenstedtii TaxID=440482 RepID=A0ABW7XIQ9_9MICO
MSTHLRDLEVHLADRPGALADLGQALGAAGVSLEGGGVFTVDGRAVAHYLVHDGARALRAVTTAGLGPAAVRDVVLARLDQEVPGQLGTLARRLGDAGVNVLVQYSDHVGNLVLLVADDDVVAAREVVAAWGRRVTPRDGTATARPAST